MQPPSRYLQQDRKNSLANMGNSLAVWAVLLGGAALLVEIYFSIHFFLAVPFEDLWAVIEELARNNGSYSVPMLWAQHNEHRLPLAKLLMQADLLWFHGRNVSLYLEIYLTQMLHLALIVWALRRYSLWPGWLIAAASGLAAFALFWTTQSQSFLNPFGVEVLPAYAFGSASIFFLLSALSGSAKNWLWLALSAGAAIFSGFSLANGLLLWPILLIMAIRFRLGWRKIAFLGGIGAIFTAAYLTGYQNPDIHAKPLESLGKPGLLASYLLVYFGMNWAPVSVRLSEVLAAFGILGFLVSYARELFRHQKRLFPFALLSLCAFLFGTGFVTALGRLNFFAIQAASSRYQSCALVFWACFSLYLMDLAHRHSARTAVWCTATVLILATAMLPAYPGSLANAGEMYTRVSAGALPLYADVKDDREIVHLIVPPDVVFGDRAFLKSHHAAFYADPRYLLLGQPLTSRFAIAPPDRCFGAFDSNRRLEDAQFGGWELVGWAWDHKALRPVQSVIAVSHDGRIHGVGENGLARPDVRSVFPEVTDSHVGWHIYLQGNEPVEDDVRLYGVLDNHTVCAITLPVHLPK